jgi:ketosteroid isomerase-like protein
VFLPRLGGCESLSAALLQGGAVVVTDGGLKRSGSGLKLGAATVDGQRSMVSEHDAALLNSFYEALNVADVDAALELCDHDVEVYLPPNVVAAVAPRGHRDVGEYLRGWFDSWHVYRPEPEDFVAAGGQVVALVHLRARCKGSRFEIEEEIADVFEFEGGKISKLRLYVQRDTALEQVKAG